MTTNNTLSEIIDFIQVFDSIDLKITTNKGSQAKHHKDVLWEESTNNLMNSTF